MERPEIGRGKEHIVYRSGRQPDWVLKRPTFFNAGLIRLFSLSTKDVGLDIDKSIALIQGTQVQIPTTRIFGFNNGRDYLIAQRFVQEDYSVKNIKEFLQSQNLPFLVDKFELNPTNFISREGVVYWVDPTKGASLIVRPLEKLGLLNHVKYTAWKAGVKRFISSF